VLSLSLYGEMRRNIEKWRNGWAEKPRISSEIGFIIDFDTDAGNLPANNGNCACNGIQLAATLIAWAQVNEMVEAMGIFVLEFDDK